MPERAEARGVEDDEEAVGAEQVQLSRLGEEEAAQGARMGVAKRAGRRAVRRSSTSVA